MSTARNAGDAAPLPVADEACDITEQSGTSGLQPSLTGNGAQGVADAPERGEHVTVPGETGIEVSEAAVVPGRGVGQALDVGGEAAATTSGLVCLDPTSLEAVDSFEKSVEVWAQSAIAVVETATNERERIAVRDQAVRVAGLAAAAGAGVAVTLAHEVLQRAIRTIGKRSRRRRAGRPRSAASDEAAPGPVGGDTTPSSAGLDSGRRPRPVVENRSPGGTNTVGDPKSTTGNSDSVRAAAVADPAAGSQAGSRSGPGSRRGGGCRWRPG
jgi:hypothetical protein